MAKTWLSIQVELLSGRGEDLWPRPGRVFIVGPRHTFADFAAAIDGAFGRWDRSHLCAFTLETGEIFGWPDPDADPLVTDLRRALVAKTIKPGMRFRYLFDYGDDWAHRCEVGPRKVDPLEIYGRTPEAPVVTFGWGDLPDQYGRRWDGDDGQSPPPPAPGQRDPMSWFTWPDVPAWALTGPPATQAPRPESALTGADLPALLGALARGHAAAVIGILDGKDPSELLQHAGEGLLLALAANHPDARRLTRGNVRGLDLRDWEGDAELAELLRARTEGAASKLTPVRVDLGMLNTLLEGDPNLSMGGWLNVRSGDCEPSFHDSYLEDGDLSEERDGDPDWLFVHIQASGDAYADMIAFASTVADESLATRLADALDGRGAFRRFRRVLDDAPDAEHVRWRAFSEERSRGRARAWLATQGYAAEPCTSGQK